MTEGAARVLEALRSADGPCSGATLSARLGVSRAQVWKHVEALRARGYAVEGTPGGGYRLAGVPDRLYAEELRAGLATRWLARDVHWLESTDSTNRVAAELGRDGAAHGSVVVAEGQTAGRGRLGRSFFSPSGRNLYTSVVLRPALTIAEAPTTILAAAIAVAESAVAELAPPGAPDDAARRVEIKWPNDVLVDGLKTSGILMELYAEATRVGFLVLGIGVNLNVGRDELPEEFRARATSLAAAAGRRIDRPAFARRLYGTLEDVLDVHAASGFEALRPRFDAFFRMRGRTIAVADSDGSRRVGTARGIDADGALLLATGAPDAPGGDRAGPVERVLAGDVTVLKEGVPA